MANYMPRNTEIFNRLDLNKENFSLVSTLNSNLSKSTELLLNSAQFKNKEKGLSIRSTSDCNIFISNNLKRNNFSSMNYLEFQDKNRIIKNKKMFSPVKIKTPKNSKLKNLIPRKLSPKILKPIEQNVMDNYNFNKTRSLEDLYKLKKNLDFHVSSLTNETNLNNNNNKNIKSIKKLNEYPEPENLAYDFSEDQNFSEIETIFEHDRKWICSRSTIKKNEIHNIVLFENEEILISPSTKDLEVLHSFQFSSITSSMSSQINDVELPDISDSDE